MTISIITLGCKVNQAESAALEAAFRRRGFSIVGLSESPEYCIVNTCTVTAKSDYQSRQLIRKAARAGAKVIVTGCYSQLKPDEVRGIAGIHSIIPNNDKLSIINILPHNTSCNTSYYTNRARPLVKVQDGCNSACSYCLVPKARGASQSVPVSEVIDQALYYESSGYREIVLTGIHLGSYGYDLDHKIDLCGLVKSLLLKTEKARIRLSSIEPTEVSEEMLELFQDNRLCRHIHVPLQSGSDTVLKNMKRPYSSRTYYRVIERINAQCGDIALGTDVIVGFPGERDADFHHTRDLLKALPFTYMHIFPFSPRPKTMAAQMPEQLESSVKKKRFTELNSLNISKRRDYLTTQIDKSLDIIVEEALGDSASLGTSSNYLKVELSSNAYPPKSLVTVRVTERADDSLRGYPITPA